LYYFMSSTLQMVDMLAHMNIFIRFKTVGCIIFIVLLFSRFR
jgi:hypothetical protein